MEPPTIVCKRCGRIFYSAAELVTNPPGVIGRGYVYGETQLVAHVTVDDRCFSMNERDAPTIDIPAVLHERMQRVLDKRANIEPERFEYMPHKAAER